MRRTVRILAWTSAIVVAVPVMALIVVLVALNTDPGRRLAERLTTRITGGQVTLAGVTGRFPDKIRVADITVRDARGAWLVVHDAALDWSPWKLLDRDAAITRLDAAEVAVARLPQSSSGAPSTDGGALRLPVRVDIDSLHVARVRIAAPVAGVPALLALDGTAHLESLQAGSAEATIRQLDGGGVYHARGRIDAAGIAATLRASEPAHGLASVIASLPDLGALSLQASIEGPWSGATAELAAAAGPLRATAKGRIDLADSAADLDVTARAPAMAPRPDLSWQSVALEAHVHGPFTRPRVRGTLDIDGLAAFGAAVRRLAATANGDQGGVALTASADGLRIPGPSPDLLAAAPLTLTANASLDAPTRPVVFTLNHPLVSLHGGAQTAGTPHAHAYLEAPDLAPLAAAGGIDLRGNTALDLKADMTEGTIALDVDGTVGVTGGMAPVPALLGPRARIGITAAVRGANVTLGRLTVDGQTLTLSARGRMFDGGIALDWHTALSDLSVLAPALRGSLAAQGHVGGTPQAIAVQADASAEVAAQGVPSGPIKLTVSATGLPDAPTGQIAAEGTLDGAKLALQATVERQTDGTLRLSIDRADWKSAHAEGAFALAPGGSLPLGRLSLRMARLDDLRRLLGQPIAGEVDGTIAITDSNGSGLARVQMTARNAGLPGTAEVDRATLAASVLNPATDPDIDATLDVSGLRAAGIGGTVQLTAKGRQPALALRLRTGLAGIGGADAQASGAALLDVAARTVAVSALQATWKGETLRLLDSARLAFGNGVAVDRLRLGLRDAVLEVAGRFSPTLDATATLSHVTADLARIVAPTLNAAGSLDARARLTGTTARPTGTVHVAASGLRLRSGTAAALPAASITADATLAGVSARVQARADAGRNFVDVAGTAPLGPAAAMDLRARGDLDLAVLEPLMAAQGRAVRGKVTLDASVSGTLSAPRADGTLRLANGEVEDFAQGAHVSDIQALIRASGDSIHIASLTGRAGAGTLSASGGIGLGGAMPVDLHLAASRASPLSSDKLSAVLDMDVSLRGDLAGRLAAAGTIKLDSADIRIPEQLPAKVVVLDVRHPGQTPPPPAPGPDIALDVTLNAPGQVFVRGRGLFAELRGRIHVTGTAAAPLPNGRFELRRGDFNLAGRTLTFTSGEVGFDGSGRIDPTLNFVASSTNGNITATLTITGYASAPKIALSSVPDLPQDEILAQLLFHQSASSLSAFQLAEAAAALAQISGVAGGVFDPLNSVRQGLGLDRLSVGGSQTGNGASVEAGRYVTRNVYVGAKQATSGGGTQATVQIDLLKGLKLETDVGTGGATSTTGASATDDPNGTSVGLTYHFDY